MTPFLLRIDPKEIWVFGQEIRIRIDVNAILSKDPNLAPAIVVMPRIFSIPETNNPIPSLSSGGLHYQQHSRSCTLCHMDGQQSGKKYYLDFRDQMI